jgi:hypothetical protein
MRNCAHPAETVYGDLSNLSGGFPVGQQPDDLPMAALHRVFGLAVARFKLVGTQMGVHIDWSFHNRDIPQDLILEEMNSLTKGVMKARHASTSMCFVDEYCARYLDLFPDVRSYE